MAQNFPSGGPFRTNAALSSRQLELSRFLSRTYFWMFVGLLITAGVSTFVASSPGAVQFLLVNRWVFFSLLIAELALVLGLSAAMNRISAGTATLGFLTYAALNGATFSTIFLTYELGSVGQAFLLAGGMFGALAVFGSVTKRSLSGVATFMMMGLFGIILLALLNLFMKSDALSFAISAAGILIFSGLTAYDAQRIRAMASQYGSSDDDLARKGAIFGALALYLDFINLFLSLLRLMGRRRS